MRLLAALAALVVLAPLAAGAQPVPQTQCVSSAVAGGTPDAITIPLLPCSVTTTLLVLKLSSNNATTTPTIQMVGATAQVVVYPNGTPLQVGELQTGAFGLFTNNGTNWIKLTSNLGPAAQNNFLFVSSFGADLSGATDSTAALNACLIAATGSSCWINRGGTLRILGAVTIPAHTTLKCGDSYLDAEDSPGTYGSLPAIKVGSVVTISAGGEGAAVQNCLIYRDGMTFPAADSTAYAGTALSDVGFGNFTVIGTTILGFDTAIDTSGTRPYIEYVYVDGTGSTHPVIYEHNGNSDGGIFNNVKIQPLGTGNVGGGVSCAAGTRPGTGFYMGGINFIGKIVSQNMRTAEFDIEFYTIADGMWADFPVGCLGAYSPVGVIIGNTQLMVNHLDLNSVNVGLLDKGQGGADWIGSLFLNSISGDCVQLGTAGGVAGGALTIGDIVTNTGNASNCGGYAVNYLDSTYFSYLTIGSGLLTGVNGGSPPYVNVPAAVKAWQINISPKVVTNLVNPAAIYGAATVGSCTGLGATGNACALMPSVLTDPFDGVVQLTVGSTGVPAASGVVQITWPLTLSNVNGCTATLQDGTAAMQSPAGVRVISVDSRNTQLAWYAASALTASQTYRIAFTCRPQ